MEPIIEQLRQENERLRQEVQELQRRLELAKQNISPVRIDKVEPIHVDGELDPILTLEHADYLLQHSQEAQARLAAIVESSDDAIVSKDLHGIVRTWNRGAEQLFGYTAQEAIGQPITLIIPPERLNEEPDILQRIRRGERIHHYETVRRRKDGTLVDISLTISPIIDAQGRIVGASKIARDISERKRVEEALRRSEKRWRTLTETLPNLVWTDLPDGQCDWLSSQWVKYTGIPEQELLGLRWLERVVHPDDRARTLALWKAACADEAEYDLEYRIRRYDGEYHWFKTRGVPIRDDQGKIIYWFGTCTDVEEFKRMEAALREADRRKDQFLATLAHELRNPLAPIRNSLHILRLAGSDSAAAERVREMMERQVNHMVRLVDDLMEVSRITRDKIELRKEQIELAAIVRSAVETSKPLIEAAHHRLAISLPAEPLMLDADPVRLAQVFANLLNNAAKYTEEGGQIGFSARRDGTEVVISVRDNGMGIPADMLSHIFDLFMQVDFTYSRSQGGLGIGLTLVRSLVGLHGGSIEAKSDGPGKGSEFIVRLPLSVRRLNPNDWMQRDDQPATFAPRRILVVDDNRDAADSLAILLRSLGADVCTANDGPSALEALRKYRPTVVLLDIGMPGMDGYEVARRARLEPEGQDATLIVLTGWGQEEERRRSQALGIDHHLIKPVDLGILQALLASLPHPSAAGSQRV